MLMASQSSEILVIVGDIPEFDEQIVRASCCLWRQTFALTAYRQITHLRLCPSSHIDSLILLWYDSSKCARTLLYPNPIS